MDTLIVIIIVGLAVLYLCRYVATSFKKGATSGGCSGCTGCSQGCSQAGDRSKVAGRILAGVDAPGASICAGVSKKNLPHSLKEFMDG